MLPEKAGRGLLYVSEWVNTYLSDAAQRLQGLVHGLEINQVDVYNFQEVCLFYYVDFVSCGVLQKHLAAVVVCIRGARHGLNTGTRLQQLIKSVLDVQDGCSRIFAVL